MANFKKRLSTDHIVIHCSATFPDSDIGVRDIRQWHLGRGWLDVGYHFVIKRDGTIEEGRPVDVVGSGVKNHNHNTLHICLVGGSPKGDPYGFEANFTEAQNKSLKELVAKCRTYYSRADVIGHHDLESGKACPSFSVSHWLDTGEFITASKG